MLIGLNLGLIFVNIKGFLYEIYPHYSPIV